MPILERRIKVIKEIGCENSIVLQLEEASSVSVVELSNMEKQNQNEAEMKEKNISTLPNRGKKESTNSFKTRQKYKDVFNAAQTAFESAIYATIRAALELS
ncbi:hypothetical protein RJT34_21663 [Clitoria ternatea]|uniref:Uncharacterized protein n=1 Tax=Clitoria ternatea TaxID=43366 RepID=A0AAN9IUU4_CLITE